MHRSRLRARATPLLAATFFLIAAGCSSSTASDAPDATSGDAAVEVGATDATAEATQDGGLVRVQILAFNDFHGNLEPPNPLNSQVLVKAGDPAIDDAGTPEPSGSNFIVHAGGAAYFAAHIHALRASNPNTLVVSAGDLTGASPLVSALYDDEPTIEVMNAIGLDVHGVGNHEFDHGLARLLRYQSGGCDDADRTDAGYGSCEADPTFVGAKFEYLAANVVDTAADAGSSTIFPAYTIKTIGGANVAFIGATLSNTEPYTPSEIVGLTFENELTTINQAVATLATKGVDAIVVLIHEGGSQSGTYDDCQGLSGSLETLVEGIDPRVAAVHTAHTHAAYNCVVGGRPVTSAAAFGRLITQIELSIDTGAHKVVSATANNVVVTRDITPDPTVAALVARYSADVAPLAQQQVGTITADITNQAANNGETALGDVITDGMLAFAATQGHPSDVAFMNVGGIRDALYYAPYASEAPGDVTYEKAFDVIPFGDTLEVVQCKGSDLVAATQQNLYAHGLQVFQVSSTFHYAWGASSADGAGMNAADPTSFTVGGKPLDPSATYDVVLVSFLYGGGDGYTAFEACTNPTPIGVDIDAFTRYLSAHQSPPLAPPAPNRIDRTN